MSNPILRTARECLPDLLWVKNDEEGAAFAFNQKGDGRWYYLGAPVEADFELSLESLAPWVTKVLDLAAPLEGRGRVVTLVEIKGGRVVLTV
jgi:hypothetical protein